MRKDLLRHIAIVGSIGMSINKALSTQFENSKDVVIIQSDELKENNSQLLVQEPTMYIRNPNPQFTTIDTEKKRTKPCKRHEYIDGICRHCNHPLK